MTKDGRGWHNDSKRHAQAARGVKTAGNIREQKAIPISNKSRALSRLKRLARPYLPHSGDVHVFQLPKREKLWYDVGGLERYRENPELVAVLRTWAYLPRERRYVNLSTLRSNQPVSTDYLEDLIRPGDAYLDYVLQSYRDEIVIVRWRGENIITDGHHRLSAMKLLGKRKANVEFLDLDKFIRDAGGN